ncbi:hypothetical protein GGF46_003287 [Coemansia sp. RSA 552]|nr:hypothetical protein GGF46_003287 [Coemansia sp. RSA 552]
MPAILSLALALGIKEPLQIHDKLMERNVAASDSSELSSDKVMFADDIESTDLGSIDLGSSTSIRKDMPLWKLILKWQVFSASITTLSLAMLMSSLDNVLSIHMKDRFGETAAKTGLLFVLNGGVAIILAMPTGSAVDWVIGRYGESARSLVQLSGLLLTSGAIFAIGMSTSFRMIIGVEAWLSMALLAVNIPVMSSFGDFVNSLGLNSMAQSYGVYNSFWAASSTVAPPVATWLYTRIGFRTMVAGLLTGLSLLCASLFLAELVWRTCKSWTKPSSLSSR